MVLATVLKQIPQGYIIGSMIGSVRYLMSVILQIEKRKCNNKILNKAVVIMKIK